MVPVFFYGLFMDADLLRSKGLHPENIRRASVKEMRLVLGKRAALVRDPDSAVFGVAMDLPKEEVERLYAEPSVAAYRPETATVELDSGERISALCYNLPEAPDASERNGAYAAQLRDLARQLVLPQTYVDSI